MLVGETNGVLVLQDSLSAVCDLMSSMTHGAYSSLLVAANETISLTGYDCEGDSGELKVLIVEQFFSAFSSVTHYNCW